MKRKIKLMTSNKEFFDYLELIKRLRVIESQKIDQPWSIQDTQLLSEQLAITIQISAGSMNAIPFKLDNSAYRGDQETWST